jgi:putative ABC transport system permease protein
MTRTNHTPAAARPKRPEGRRRRLSGMGSAILTRLRHLSLDGIRQDARYALRAMRKKPAFTALAIVTLALGIGVNTASVAVAYGILVRPLPYHDASRVVVLNLLFPDGGDLGFSPAALQAWLPRLRTVESAAGYYRREVSLRSGDRSDVVPAAFVTEKFFEVLGRPGESGRAASGPQTSEILVGRRRIDRLVSGDAKGLVGMPVIVSDKPHTIGGVVPSEFAFPDDEVAVWVRSAALVPGTKPQNAGYSKIVARLARGATLEQFRDEANRVRLELNPKSREVVSLTVLSESAAGVLRPLVVAALAGALLVLLVASANVATLFIGRDVSRARELAARMALGATPLQLVRSVLVETALVAVMASLAGMGIGAVALKVFVSQAAGGIPGLHRVSMGMPIVLAIAALTAIVTLGCAAAPAWHAARADFQPFLRAAGASRPRAWRVREALVVAQIALSCVLLVGAGLLARTVSVLMMEDHGFEPTNAIEAKVVLSDVVLFTNAAREAFVRDLVARARALPGVEHAGFGTNLPPRPAPITMSMRVVRGSRDETRLLKVGMATPGYFRALGARFVAGRDFEEADGRPGASSVILSESAARFYYPDEDPIGRTISSLPAVFGVAGSPRIVGVIRDLKAEGLDSPATSAVYIPWGLRPLGSGYLVVRASGDGNRLASEVRSVARALDPAVPVPEVQTLEDVLAQSIANRRVRAMPAVGFGVLALAVAFVGVLATLATLVAERRRDLAIRAALGASPAQLTWTIAGRGLVLTACGVAAGLGLGGAASRGLSSLLYGVGPYDALTFAGTALVVGGGAVLMTYVAARGTRRVDPIAALKTE